MAEEIWHHGIKGMKWGVRRFQNKDGSLTRAGKKRYGLGEDERAEGREEDNQEYKYNKPGESAWKGLVRKIRGTSDQHGDYKKAHDRKSVKKMSDAELRSRLNRLNMEKQYSQMNPSRVARGRKILTSSLKVAGTVAATSTTAITLKNNWKTISGWFD